MRPKSVGGSRIDHQFALWTDRLARRPHDHFVGCVVTAAERSPTDLEGAKSALHAAMQFVLQLRRLLHQHRGIGFDAIAKFSTQQSMDGLMGDLSENVPERHVNSADG